MRTLREQKTCLMHVYPVRPMARTPLEVLNATNGLAVFPESRTRATNLKLRTAHHFYLCSTLYETWNNATFNFNWRKRELYRIDGYSYIGNFRRLFSRESRSIVIVARNSRPIVTG